MSTSMDFTVGVVLLSVLLLDEEPEPQLEQEEDEGESLGGCIFLHLHGSMHGGVLTAGFVSGDAHAVAPSPSHATAAVTNQIRTFFSMAVILISPLLSLVQIKTCRCLSLHRFCP